MALGTPANEVQSTLSTAFTRGTDTSIVLASGGGTNFPSTSQIVRLTDGDHWCLLQYASKSTDTLTMTNATDYAAAVNVSTGDAAYTWPIGSTVELVVAADYLENVIHDNVASEISAITEKTAPVAADMLVIEDSAASNVKKKVQVGKLAYSAFSVYRNLAQSIPDATFTKVELDTEIFDIGGEFDSTTNYQFKPTHPGYYVIAANAAFVNIPAQTKVIVQIRKNGTCVALGRTNGAVADYLGQSASVVVYLDGSADYVELYVYQNSGAANDLANHADSPGYVVMSGHLLVGG